MISSVGEKNSREMEIKEERLNETEEFRWLEIERFRSSFLTKFELSLHILPAPRMLKETIN